MIASAFRVYPRGMNRSWTMLGCWLCLLPQAAAGGPTAAELCARIDSLYHESPHWQVAFDQKVHYPVFDETETEAGKLGVGPAGRFRLTTDRYVIVSDGDTLWTHNLRANQVIVDLVARAGETVRPADFLFHFKEDYRRELCDVTGPGTCLHLSSTEETAFIREMWLWTDPKTAMVKRAVYKDINLNETTFDFKSVDFKYAPGPAEFRYEPPPGVEVVRMPKGE
jgi:outer membrane lipoprotein-sorting protein